MVFCLYFLAGAKASREPKGSAINHENRPGHINHNNCKVDDGVYWEQDNSVLMMPVDTKRWGLPSKCSLLRIVLALDKQTQGATINVPVWTTKEGVKKHPTGSSRPSNFINFLLKSTATREPRWMLKMFLILLSLCLMLGHRLGSVPERVRELTQHLAT